VVTVPIRVKRESSQYSNGEETKKKKKTKTKNNTKKKGKGLKTVVEGKEKKGAAAFRTLKRKNRAAKPPQGEGPPFL